MKIGIVDLDTSHPAAWIPVERDLGCEVAGVWDGGSVHPDEYVRAFAEKNGIPRVYESLDQMVADVDCAIIHGCDWDTHVPKARPFVEAGKAVLLDKPLAGNLKDLRQIQNWCEQGARITGGSSLRFCNETRQFLQRPIEERGAPHTVLAGCGVDEFNYGIHAYSLLCGLLGSGAVSARHLGRKPQRRVEIRWPNGRIGIVVVGPAAKWVPFHAAIATDRGVAQFTVVNAALYRALLESVLPYLRGGQPPPVAMPELMEPELCALAARKSWLDGDREVKLSELTEADGGYDGAAFAEEYRKQKYPPAVQR